MRVPVSLWCFDSPPSQIDILENKLKEGIKVARYVKSYGERPNEIDPVCKCEFLILQWVDVL